MTYNVLTQEQVDFFLENGYVVIRDCFTQEQADWVLEDVWIRLNMEENDSSSWDVSRVLSVAEHGDSVLPRLKSNTLNMPSHRWFSPKEFAPKAWGAICDLLGGEDRIDEQNSLWQDNMIVNFGGKKWEGDGWVRPRELDNWHVDGDTFLHFLDSREQGLLVTPIYSDEIQPRGGGTMIAPDGISKVAKYLYDHAEGVRPGEFGAPDLMKECNQFAEMTGRRGDVVLCHPLMLHSASRNALRIPRFITNAKVKLKENFQFDRPEGELSLVEQKTLRALGMKPFSFVPTAPRQTLYPTREVVWDKIRAGEIARIKTARNGTKV